MECFEDREDHDDHITAVPIIEQQISAQSRPLSIAWGSGSGVVVVAVVVVSGSSDVPAPVSTKIHSNRLAAVTGATPPRKHRTSSTLSFKHDSACG